MLSRGERLPTGEWRVDLATPPDHVGARSDLNLKWNQRTINLLARAKRASWDGLPPPPGEPRNAQLRADPEAWGGVFNLHRHDWADDGFWEEVEQTRSRRLRADEKSLGAVQDILENGACVHRILRNAYTIETADVWIRPAECCGSCDWCRKHPGDEPYGRPDIQTTTKSGIQVRGRLGDLLSTGKTPVIHFSRAAPDWRAQVRRVVEAAIRDGLMTVVLSEDDELQRQLRSAATRTVTFFESAATPPNELQDLPTLFLLAAPDDAAVPNTCEAGSVSHRCASW